MPSVVISAAVFLLLCSGASVAGNKSATAEDFRKAQDDYYASDLDAAITEARERTHHYDYSSEFRYDRTTSQSIRFSRMRNNELEQQRIETASLAPTSSGNPEDSEYSAEDSSEVSSEWNTDGTEDGFPTDLLERNDVLPTTVSPAASQQIQLPSSGIQVQVNVR
ncbi:hypothetical protein [Thalassolituus sp.]|uniref:hypothetical protein n=1 Tax=Thalassolituus sp. TaxID=2030822 RepID=UPI0035190039